MVTWGAVIVFEQVMSKIVKIEEFLRMEYLGKNDGGLGMGYRSVWRRM